MILGEALPQVVDVGVPNPVRVRAALDRVTLTPHLAEVVDSNLFRGMTYFDVDSRYNTNLLLPCMLTFREEVNADVRQTLWEIGALGDCTAEELSEGWKRPETKGEVSADECRLKT